MQCRVRLGVLGGGAVPVAVGCGWEALTVCAEGGEVYFGGAVVVDRNVGVVDEEGTRKGGDVLGECNGERRFDQRLAWSRREVNVASA